jgi:CheY-like chemotaxis protein
MPLGYNAYEYIRRLWLKSGGRCVMGPGDDSELVRQIRDALTCLYDHARLQRHPLAELLVPSQAVVTRTRAQELRRILLDAIEVLNPGDNVPIRAMERRPYAILYGLYVEGRRWEEVAASLSIGGRQLRRDRATALRALASILRDRYLAIPATGALPWGEEPLRLESERLAQQRDAVDLGTLVDELLPLLEGMARKRGVRLLSHVKPGLPRPHVNRTLMRQILIGLASPALTALPLARLAFEAWPSDMAVGIGLDLEYRQQDLQAGTGLAALDLRAVETLTATLGGRLLKEPLTDHEERVWVLLPLREETVVLVVDDNEELFELFQRYAVGQAYRLVHAASADQALNLIQSVKPDIITLDLMMPNRDGWEFLRALRSNRASVSIPVIVCSVLEEPELALSLGAQVCLKKPVEQADLLQALAEAKTMVWAEEARRGLPAHRPVPQSL